MHIKVVFLEGTTPTIRSIHAAKEKHRCSSWLEVPMELARYKACICEGSAENAIMDILLDHNLLIFSREEMIEEEIIRCREGKKFEEN